MSVKSLVLRSPSCVSPFVPLVSKMGLGALSCAEGCISGRLHVLGWRGHHAVFNFLNFSLAITFFSLLGKAQESVEAMMVPCFFAALKFLEILPAFLQPLF